MLSQSTVEELRNELAILRNRVAAIESILAGVNDMAPARRANVPTPIAENGTFSSDVRRALRAIGKTTTSADVSAWLEQHGGSQHTTRPLRGAVAVELFRMAKKSTGGVKKISRGRYRIDPQQELN